MDKRKVLLDYVTCKATIDDVFEAVEKKNGKCVIIYFEKKGEKFECEHVPGAWTLEELRELKSLKGLYLEIVDREKGVVGVTPAGSPKRIEMLLTTKKSKL
jgi:hypothetical protein